MHYRNVAANTSNRNRGITPHASFQLPPRPPPPSFTRHLRPNYAQSEIATIVPSIHYSMPAPATHSSHGIFKLRSCLNLLFFTVPVPTSLIQSNIQHQSQSQQHWQQTNGPQIVLCLILINCLLCI